MEPASRFHPQPDAGRPEARVVFRRFRLEQPFLPGFQLRQRTEQIPFRLPDERRHHGVDFPGPAYLQAGGGILQLTQKGGIVINGSLHNSHAGGGTLLSGMTESAFHQILYSLIRISRSGDDHGILSAGFSQHMQVRPQFAQHFPGAEGSRHDHAVQAGVHQKLAGNFIARHRHELKDVFRHTGAPERLYNLPSRINGQFRRFEHHGISRHQGGSYTARRNGEGEIPGRHYANSTQRGHFHAVVHSVAVQAFRVIAAEVYGLAHLHISLRGSLPGIPHHGSNSFPPDSGQLLRRPVQDFSAFANAFGRPGGTGPVRRDQGMFNLVKVRISEFIGNFIMAGRIAPHAPQISRNFLTIYNQRDFLAGFFLLRGNHPVDPFRILPQRPVRIPLVGKGIPVM